MTVYKSNQHSISRNQAEKVAQPPGKTCAPQPSSDMTMKYDKKGRTPFLAGRAKNSGEQCIAGCSVDIALGPIKEHFLIFNLATFSRWDFRLQWISDCYLPPILDLPNVFGT